MGGASARLQRRRHRFSCSLGTQIALYLLGSVGWCVSIFVLIVKKGARDRQEGADNAKMRENVALLVAAEEERKKLDSEGESPDGARVLELEKDIAEGINRIKQYAFLGGSPLYVDRMIGTLRQKKPDG